MGEQGVAHAGRGSGWPETEQGVCGALERGGRGQNPPTTPQAKGPGRPSILHRINMQLFISQLRCFKSFRKLHFPESQNLHTRRKTYGRPALRALSRGASLRPHFRTGLQGSRRPHTGRLPRKAPGASEEDSRGPGLPPELPGQAFPRHASGRAPLQNHMAPHLFPVLSEVAGEHLKSLCALGGPCHRAHSARHATNLTFSIC